MSGLPSADPGLMLVLDRQRRLSVGDYHRMIGAGILDEDDRVELIEGVIVEMTPQGPRHATRYRTLVTLSGDQAFESAAVPGFVFRVDALFE